MRPPRALPAAHFDRNETYAYFGDRTLGPGSGLLSLKPPSGHAVGFIRSEINEDLGDFARIGPLTRIFIRFGRTVHRGIHAAAINPLKTNYAFGQFRCPGLRHTVKTEFGDAIRAPPWPCNDA